MPEPTQQSLKNPWQKMKPLTEDELKSSISGSIKTVHVGVLYQLGLFFAMVAMMLLPLLYISLIALAGCGLYYHAVKMPGILSDSIFSISGVVAYVGPLIAGGILLLFMIKPIFSRPDQTDTRIRLQHEDAPLFFALAEIISKLVRAPKPNAIMVNCEANASANFNKGLFNFSSHDLILTFGMPLVAALSVRQIAGVMAHEFGHFSQRAGMRMSYIVRKINYWFFRVVHERDNWDALLLNLFESADIYSRIILGVARIFVWITRKILRVFMMAGNLISGFFSRQMEHDADRYEIRIAGVNTFKSTTLRMEELNLAAQRAYFEMAYAWEERRLVDDYPKYVLARADLLAKDKGALQKQSREPEKTGFFDTHYSVKYRIKKAGKEKTDGVIHINARGVALFKDPESLSKKATLSFYKALILDDISPENLIAADRFVKQQKAIDQEASSGQKFFGETANVFRPPDLTPLKWREQVSELDFQKLKHELEISKKFLANEYENARAANKRWGKINFEKLELHQKIALLTLKETNTSLDFRSDKKKAKQKLESLRSEELKLAEKLTDYESRLISRIKIDLLLLNCPPVTDKLSDLDDLTNRLQPVLQAIEFLVPLSKIINRLREKYLEAENFYKLDNKLSGIAAYEEKQKGFHAELNKDFAELKELCEKIAYPFEHAQSPITLDKVLVDAEPAELDFDHIVNLTMMVLNRYPDFYFRMMGTLSNVAEKVEGSFSASRSQT
jgi:hypothetical protein